MSEIKWTDWERDAVDLALHADDCPDDDCPGGDLGEYRREAEIALAALTPFVAARERAAAATALRDAAERDVITIPDWLGYRVFVVAARDLLNRADQIDRP